MIILNLIQNIALLVALSAIYQITEARWKQNYIKHQALSGLLFGGVGLVGMMTPVNFQHGIIFDGRSIILSVAGLFGGPVAAFVAVLICGAYRLWLGGAGAVMGVSVIVESAAVGVLFYYLRRRANRPMNLLSLWAFGLLVHVIMVLLAVTLPDAARQAVWRQLGWMILVLYPIATMLVCRLFLDYEEQRRDRTALEESEERHRVTLLSVGDGVISTDVQGRVKLMNPVAETLTGWRQEEARDQQFDEVFRILDEGTRQPVVSPLGKVLREGTVVGLTNHTLLLAKDGSERPISDAGAPIRNEQNAIIGVVLVFRDRTEERAARKALRESEQRFRLLYEQSPAPYQSLNVDGLILEVNDAWLQELGYTRSEVIGKWFGDFLAGSGPALFRERFPQFKERGEVRGIEYEIKCKHGGAITALFEGKIGRDTQDGFVQTHCVFTNISQRKHAEGDRQRLHDALNASLNEIYLFDAETLRFRFVSVGARRNLGYSMEALGQMTPLDLKPEHTMDSFAALVAPLRSGEKSVVDFTTVHRRANGTVYPVEVHMQLCDPAEDAVFLAVILDITERKQAEKRIKEQAALLNAANDAIYVRTLDHTITFWNDGAERLYGWTRDQALGRPVTELGTVDQATFNAAHAVLLNRGDWSGEMKRANKDGQERTAFCRWTLLRDEQGEPKKVLAIDTDITEQKHLEAKFLRAQRLEAIGALAGGIAHDLNNILTPILMTGPLLRETVRDPESREMLNTVETCAERGANIIRQLLTFARGKPGARVPLPLRHLLGEMEKLIHETFPRNVQPRVNVSDELWPVLGDATQVHQAIMNLCVYARDAMPDGGTLTLAAENAILDEAFAVMTPEAKPGHYVLLSVTDTGLGISPEHLDRIYDPFFTTKEIGKGTGLGLPTVLGIIRGHGGFVRVNSRLGLGTTFELFLPASPAATTTNPISHEPQSKRGQGELVLVVDDEITVRGMVRHALEKYGYQVVTAEEGREALALFNRNRSEVQAVITDLMMPGMDGSALVSALRQIDPLLPILGMTGLADRAAVKELESLKLTMLLTKPFSVSELTTALHQTFDATRKPPVPS